MLLQVCWLFLFCGFSSGSSLWSQGVVHYSIDAKHYDFHSQDIITSTLAKIEKEICVKFFAIPANYSMGDKDKMLLISNPLKVKTCGNLKHDYSRNIVLLPIGYQCLNEMDITRAVVDLLRASIKQSKAVINSNDLLKKFKEMNDDPSRPTLLPPSDRNYINAHYNAECEKLSSKPSLGLVKLRRLGEGAKDLEYESNIDEYYASKVWPLGIVMYKTIKYVFDGDNPEKHKDKELKIQEAMEAIQSQTCIVFHELKDDDASNELEPKNYLEFNFNEETADETFYGFKEGVQKLNLTSFLAGAPGHDAHIIYQLMRVLGVPMMSNRHDRDNYITINWKFVEKGKEHLLERDPPAAWLRDVPYDFRSASHAPGNFACDHSCRLGAQTVQPLQDHLWQRTMTMGHTTELSEADVQTIGRIYGNECAKRQQTDA